MDNRKQTITAVEELIFKKDETLLPVQKGVVDVHQKIKKLLSKIPVYKAETNFKNLYKDYTTHVKGDLFVDSLDFRSASPISSEEKTISKIAETVDGSVNAIKTIAADWKKLKEIARDSKISVVQLLADNFAGMDSEEYKITKDKLATFKKAVDKMPGVTRAMRQVVSDMSQALALAELNPKEKIVYQHGLEITHAMKENSIEKLILATEKLGKFLSEPENERLNISEMKNVKKLLSKAMPISSNLIKAAKKAVDQSEDRGIKEGMQQAFKAVSSLRHRHAKLGLERLEKGMVLSGKKLADAKIPCVFFIENDQESFSGCYVSSDGTKNWLQLKEKEKIYIKENFKEFGTLKIKGKKNKEFIEKLAIKAESRQSDSQDEMCIKAKKFIKDSLIPDMAQREKIEKLIKKLEKESLKFTNIAARDRAIMLTKELKQHTITYYSGDKILFSFDKFTKNCNESIKAAQKDIDKNAPPSWREILEAIKNFISNFSLSKSKEKSAGMAQNPHTFYAANKEVMRVVSDVQQEVKKAGPLRKTK